MVMTKFGTLRSQFTKCSVHNGKILSMRREDFHALKKDFFFAQRKLNKGGFSPSNRGKKNLRGSISALLFIRYLWALFILESVYIKKLIPRCDLQRGISLSLLFEQWMFARLANKEYL